MHLDCLYLNIISFHCGRTGYFCNLDNFLFVLCLSCCIDATPTLLFVKIHCEINLNSLIQFLVVFTFFSVIKRLLSFSNLFHNVAGFQGDPIKYSQAAN